MKKVSIRVKYIVSHFTHEDFSDVEKFVISNDSGKNHYYVCMEIEVELVFLFLFKILILIQRKTLKEETRKASLN